MPGNLETIPASVIASWPTPNYTHPIRRTWMPVYVGVLQAVMTLMLGTRLWLRAQRKAGALGLDDALLVPAFLTATMFAALVIIGTEKYGLDRHIWDVRATNFENVALVGWLAEIAFIVSTCCTKISVLLFYRRLTEGTFERTWQAATISAIVFTLLYGIAFVLILLLNCQPIDAYWKSYSSTYTTDYHCVDTTVLNPLQGALSIFTDLYAVLLPVTMMWRLEASRQQRWALNGIFSLGLLVVVAGAFRTYYLEKLGTHWDITWNGFDVFIWSDLEAQLAIICASAPALRVFFRRYLSDPINRAIHSARSASARSAHRESKQLDTIALAKYQHDSHEPADDGIGKEANVSLDSTPELEAGAPSRSPTPNEHVVKTPGDYESFALHSLQKQRASQAYDAWRRYRPKG